MRLYIALCLLLCAIRYGIAQSAVEYLTERERWGQSHTFEWEVDIQNEYSASLIAEISRLPAEAQKQVKEQANTRKHKTLSRLLIKRHSQGDIGEYRVLRSTQYPQEVFRFLFAGDFLAVLHSQITAQDTSIRTLYVIPTPSEAIYSGVPPYHSGIGGDIVIFQPAFLMAANPLKVLSPLAWRGYDTQLRWSEKGDNLFVASPSEETSVVLRLSAQRGYAPAALMVREATNLYNWKVLEWEQIDDTWIPRVVHYEYQGRSMRSWAQVRLVSVKPTSGNNSSASLFPLGASAVDFRLQEKFLDSPHRSEEGVVTYIYSGSFPSKDQLKQLAYQQGNLLPPETPQRRYSLWMFLPAIALFGLALLLYLRRKR